MPRPKKRFGQHFLSNPRILDRIVGALELAPGERVLEIGPGQGTLTAALLRAGAQVTAIEIDRELAPIVRERLPAVRLVEGDALELDWHVIMGPGPFLVAGNIPYQITSPLLDKALTPPRPRRIVFLVQKEVADRLTAAPGSDGYGALSIGVQAVARAERLFLVPAGAFHPSPRVDSAVVRLEPLGNPLVADAELTRFRRLVTGLFGFRRKQLLRGLRQLTGWPASRVAAVLADQGIAATARPETLAPGAFVALFHRFVDAGWRGE
jgi:16S rRNA (adenine1518-N6/adenine1519-N6)-dimethyltransferase